MKGTKVDIEKVFQERVRIDAAIVAATREVWIQHKKLGIPLVSWDGEKVVMIPPEEIDVEAWMNRPQDDEARTS